MSSGCVHPGPITAVNHKGKRLLSYICLCVPARPPRWPAEHAGNIRYLPSRAGCRGINMQRHAPDTFLAVCLYGWIWVHPHVCISKWWSQADLCLCSDLNVSPFGMRLNLVLNVHEKKYIYKKYIYGYLGWISLNIPERIKKSKVCPRISFCGCKYVCAHGRARFMSGVCSFYASFVVLRFYCVWIEMFDAAFFCFTVTMTRHSSLHS